MGLAFSYILRHNFDRLERLLYFSSIFFALLFVGLHPLRSFPLDYLVKALPIFFQALLVLKHVRGSQGLLLFLGLLFCAAGDIFLHLGQEKFFLTGAMLFLVAHVFYILTFFRDFRFRASWLPVALLILLYGVGASLYLAPVLGERLIPVLLYITILCLMGAVAVFRDPPGSVVFYGALLFILSDSLLALNVFFPRDPFSFFFVMPVYYLAQFLTVAGYLFDPEVVTSDYL